jgi:tetratricopeptide (TPR) repeat protein
MVLPKVSAVVSIYRFSDSCRVEFAMRRITLGLFCVTTIIAILPAQPARADDMAICASRGTEDFKKDDYAGKGMAACTKVIDEKQVSGKRMAIAYALRGYWKHQAKQLDAALADYEKALSIDTTNHEFYDYRADIWVDKGNDERALAEYEQALRLKPAYLAARYSRGRIYEKRGDLEKARAEYTQVVTGKATERIGEWAKTEARERLKEMDEKLKKP